MTREGPFWVIQRVPQLRKFDNRRKTFLRVFRVYIYVCIEREREREREQKRIIKSTHHKQNIWPFFWFIVVFLLLENSD